MRHLFIITLALLPTAAVADRAGPPELYKPVPKTIVAEQPCDATRRVTEPDQLVGKYMCQIGLDGKFFEPYPLKGLLQRGARPVEREWDHGRDA